MLPIEVLCDRSVAAAARAAIGRLDDSVGSPGAATLVASEPVSNVMTHARYDGRRHIALTLAETCDALTIPARDPMALRPHVSDESAHAAAKSAMQRSL